MTTPTKNRKHHETHAVCNKHNIGGESVCCACSGKKDCDDKTGEEEEKFRVSYTVMNIWAIIWFSIGLTIGFNV